MRVSWARALFVNDLAMQLTHEISQAALFSGVAVTGVAVMEVAVVLWAFVCFACAPPDLNAVYVNAEPRDPTWCLIANGRFFLL